MFASYATLPSSTRCLLLRGDERAPEPAVTSVSLDQIPNKGDVLVRVLYSGVNYKDALAVKGRGRIVRASYPFVPGIDLVGEVVASDESSIEVGQLVIGTGWGLGEDIWGGYSVYQRVSSRQLIPLPVGMDPRVAATAGTAGLTAMLAVMEIERGGVSADSAPILVTGASGGVGSLAILFLTSAGFEVVGSTGKASAGEYLRELGAAALLDRTELAAGPIRAMESARWGGAVDSVGGTTLAAILSQTARHGVVASCGLVGGPDFSTTVFPLILRGVRLVGIDSNTCPNDRRLEAWRRIHRHLDSEIATRIGRTIGLDDVVDACDDVLAGRVVGRLVVRVFEE